MEDKQSYLDKLALQLQKWDDELDALKLKAESAKAEARVELQEQITELREKKAAAQSKLKSLQEAGDEAWDEIKAGAEKSWTEIRGAFDRAFAKFKS